MPGCGCSLSLGIQPLARREKRIPRAPFLKYPQRSEALFAAPMSDSFSSHDVRSSETMFVAYKEAAMKGNDGGPDACGNDRDL